MTESTRPFLVLYVVWHPLYAEGASIAELLRHHFRRKHYENISSGMGLSVIFRSAPTPGAATPMPIDMDEAETTAVVVLAEATLAGDSAWIGFVRELVEHAEARGLGSQIFPVMLERAGLDIRIDAQALRWDRWEGPEANRRRRLVRELAYGFSRMLRHYLEHLKRPEKDEIELERYLKKVEIFLSHSKHDKDGERITRKIRDWLHESGGLSSFFDVHDIPAGLPFPEVLLHQIKTTAVVVIHTDSYSSREWCRREIIEAKRWNVPMIVANCIRNIDERSFPYMGNVPVVRMDPDRMDRIDQMVGRLLDEVFKDFLWRCRVERLHPFHPQTLFMARAPELISLSSLPTREGATERSIVYPDPPLSAEEAQLFANVGHNVRLHSLTEWLGENGT